ncbi:hypothetical protein [Granulicella arctica]|nr:hypothetical protein [Granulicella arctica]
MMDHLNPYTLLLVTVSIAAFGVVSYWLYSVASNLYQDFMHFSRRFRGVE